MYAKNVIQRLLIAALAIAIIAIALTTKNPAWYGIGMVYGIVFFLLPPLLFWYAGQQRGKGSLLSARMYLLLDKIYPRAPKSSAGIYFELAAQLFSQVRESVSHYHSQKTPREIDFLRTAPEMRLAEQLYRKAQNLEKQFIEIEPESRLIHQRNAAIADEELGYLYRCQHRFDKAIQHLSSAADYLKELTTTNPDDTIAIDSLAMSIFRLAEIDHIQGRHKEATEGYKEALTLFRMVGNQREMDLAERFLRELS